MFTRTLDCKLKPEFRQQFIDTLRNEVLPTYKTQPGFVDLVTFMSDEHPDHAFVFAVWKTKSEADNFYFNHAPLVDTLKQFVKEQQVEHFYIETSLTFKAAAGKAA